MPSFNRFLKTKAQRGKHWLEVTQLVDGRPRRIESTYPYVQPWLAAWERCELRDLHWR